MSDKIPAQDDRDWNFYHNDKWPYDKFIKTYILKMMDYGFVKEHYDRNIQDFRYPAPVLEVRLSTLPVKPEGAAWFSDTLDAVEKAGLLTLFQFIPRVSTRKGAEAFLEDTGIPLLNLMALMDFFKQWWFPFGAQLRQLVEDTDQATLGCLEILKNHGLSQGFALLEIGRTKAGRKTLAGQTGIPGAILLDMTNRADVTRLPYVSGATVKRCWAIGYDSLEKLRGADPEEYYARASQYYASIHKPNPFDAKLEYIRGFLGNAKRAPVVVEG
jgi:hypothetical protein